jgi:hypothetical protein
VFVDRVKKTTCPAVIKGSAKMKFGLVTLFSHSLQNVEGISQGRSWKEN